MKEQFETLPGFDIRKAVRLSIDNSSTLDFGDETLPPQSVPKKEPEPEGTSRFQVGKLLGKGGMGSVSVAFDRVLQREVAVKTLISKAQNSSTSMRRFMRESQITAQLSHPSIVPIHSLETNGSSEPTLIMKRIHGQTMEEYINDCWDLQANGEDLPEKYRLPARIDMIINVCEAISYAHSRGVVHRDLKPPNIMVGEFDEVYVMDWGIAKLIDDDMADEESISLSGTGVHTQVGALMGSPFYMSPEQARADNAKVGPASDQYAIGMILYEMVVLDTVRSGDTLKELLMEANDGMLPDFSKQKVKVDPALQAIILTCLKSEPNQRYPSVAALTLDLRRLNRGASVAVYAESINERILRFITTHTTFTLGTFLSIMLVIVAIFTFNLQSSLETQEKATTEKENTSRLIQIVSGHARSIDQVLGEAQLLVHGLSEVIQLKYDLPRTTETPCTLPENLPLRPYATTMVRYEPHSVSLHEPTCPVVNVDDPRVKHSQLFASDITQDLISAYQHNTPFEELPNRIKEGNHPFHWTYVGLEDGTIVNYPGISYFPDGYDPRIRPWYKSGLEYETPQFSMPYPDAVGTGYLLPCNKRVEDSNGQTIGVVGVDLSMDMIISIMEKLDITVDYQSLLLNENGAIMFRSSERGQKIESNAAMNGDIKSLHAFQNQDLVQQIQNESPNGLIESPEGLYVYSRLTFAPWTLVVSLEPETLSCENCLTGESTNAENQ